MPIRCMPSSLFYCLGIVIGLLLAPVPAQAQEQSDTTDQQLPEIAPREIEIRGELQVSFPSLERQPLSGFASPPKIPSVPSDRIPYVESYKQALEDLPESLPAPEAASQSVSQPAPADEGFLQIGGGRYISRFVEGRYFLELTDNQSFSFHGDYFGTNGFVPFPEDAPDLETPSDEFEGSVQFESRHDGLAVQADAHGQADRYTLYGRPSVVDSPDPNAPERTGLSGGFGAQLRTFGSVESRLGAGFDRTAYATELSPSADSSQSFTENRLHLDGRLRLPIAGRETHADLTFDRSTYGGDVTGSSGFSVDGGVGLTAYTTDQLSFDAGVRIMSHSAPVTPDAPTPSTDGATHVLPSARVEFRPTPDLTLFAENQPTLTSNGLNGLYAENPYAEHAPSVRPTVYTTNAEAGVVTSLGPVRLQSRAGFRYAPTYRFFSTPVTPSGDLGGPMQVNYRSARIIRGGAQLALQGIEGVEASVDAFLRNGTLVGSDNDIPYFAPVVAHAMLSISFADQKGLVQTTGTIEGPRPIAPDSDREVNSYVAFDVEGSYRITSLLDAVVEVRNLSPGAPTRWARYARPPATVSAGFRIHW